MKQIFALMYFLVFFTMCGGYTFALDESDAEWLQIGDMRILAITDAHTTMEKSLVPELSKFPEFAGLFDRGPIPAVDRSYFLEDSGHKVLIDSGWGKEQKITGQTLELLAANGIQPQDITDILLTHMDFDHVGGLVEKGKAVFPKAELWISAQERDAWSGGAIQKRPPQAIAKAKEVLSAYKDRVRTFTPGEEILPGIFAVDASGHTPGHTAFDIISGTQKLVIAGDLMHIADLQLQKPELSTVYDIDMEKAAQSRSRILARAATEKSVLAGMHFPMISPVIPLENGGFAMRQARGR